MRPLCVVLTLSVLAHCLPCAAAEPWRYVVPEPGQEHEHPPLRALPLTPHRPEDLHENVQYRGQRQRYGQLRYGSPGAPPVAVVVDEVSRGEADLYVDRNGDGIIEPAERLEPQGRRWRTRLDAIVLGEHDQRVLPRSVVFQLGRTGITLAYATLGYVEGTVELEDGRTVAARRQDGDGNGLFADGDDRLWLDLDGDGDWDLLREQFLHAPVLQVDGVRYAVRGDQAGHRLRLTPLTGSGRVRLVMQPYDAHARVTDISVVLGGRDGSAIRLGSVGTPLEVPAGEYRLYSVVISLAGPDLQPWTFVFDGGRTEDEQGRNLRHWHRVDAGETIDVDPIGRLQLIAEGGTTSVLSGDQLAVDPRLYTEEGLLIRTCYLGNDRNRQTSLTMLLLDSSGEVLADARSGFA